MLGDSVEKSGTFYHFWVFENTPLSNGGKVAMSVGVPILWQDTLISIML